MWSLDVPKYWLLLCVRKLIWIIDIFADLLFGHTFTKGSSEERMKAQNYEHSAQLVKVLCRAKPSEFALTKEFHFIFKHKEYINPRCILEKSNITLSSIEKDHVLFCVAEPGVDVYDCQKFPFSFLSQYFMAVELIILPISSFHQLADELGDPKVKVAMVNMTARCGSTLLAQVFNRVPKTRSMSEPWALCNIPELLNRGKITPEENRRLLRSGVRLQAKVEPGSGIEIILMKMNPFNSTQFEHFAKLFPDFYLFFNTRQPAPSIKSMIYILNFIFHGLYGKLGYFWHDWAKANFFLSKGPKYDHILKHFDTKSMNISVEECAVMIFIHVLTSYFDHKSIYKRAILYENLSGNPEEEIAKIFGIMEIDLKHVPAAAKALQKDSQDGTFGKQGQARATTVPSHILNMVNRYAEDLGISEIKHPMSLEEFKEAFGV